ncbi:MAG: hypothetical protein ACYCSI_11135 [Solirubrobacteraceae bacterium]
MTPQDPNSGAVGAGPQPPAPSSEASRQEAERASAGAGMRAHATRTRHHLARAVRFSPSEIRRAMSEVEGFNAKLAVVITHGVGSMACAYVFCLISLTSLPAVLISAGAIPKGDVPHFLQSAGLILIISWVAQTFFQLVLLSVIMVGQDVQSIAADARAENTFNDTQAILDALNTETQGGLRTILEAVEAQAKAA